MAAKGWESKVKIVFFTTALTGLGYLLLKPSIEEHHEKAATYASALDITMQQVASNSGSPKGIDLSHYTRQTTIYTDAESASDDVAYDGWAFPGGPSERLSANAACVTLTSVGISVPAKALEQRARALEYNNDSDPQAVAAYQAMGAACLATLESSDIKPGSSLNLIANLIQD